ncbi:heme exporter protein CcmD [Enterovirga sp. DB1703]|uniref:Heme exporter protein D n=2 Tax=Enterovirga aerilata TaxID=2730920 RepID=A0A849IBC8_9HYPH|nr:heme exporter protein CcmD [Enterovirga sp. DB1703]
MEEAGRHAVFIWSAYGATTLIALGLVIRAVLDHRAQRRALARLEAAGAVPPGRKAARG